RRLTTLAPQTDAFLPSLQRFLAVTAVVEFNVAVQAHVHEVTGEVFQVGPASGGIGYYQCHTMAAQQVDKGFIEFKTRRKLPQEGPGCFFKVDHATGKKIRQWLFNIAQTLDVRNVA